MQSKDKSGLKLLLVTAEVLSFLDPTEWKSYNYK